MKRLMIMLAFVLALSGCTVNKALHTANVVDLSTKSLYQYENVEQKITENSHLFSKEEKELLKATAEQVWLSRAEIFRLYNSGALENMANGSALLERYQELRIYYVKAIDIVQSKVDQMPDLAAIDVQVHINTVRQLDSSIQAMLSMQENQKQALQSAVTLMSVVARIAIIAGA